jgi:hypothetical protein
LAATSRLVPGQQGVRRNAAKLGGFPEGIARERGERNRSDFSTRQGSSPDPEPAHPEIRDDLLDRQPPVPYNATLHVAVPLVAPLLFSYERNNPMIAFVRRIIAVALSSAAMTMLSTGLPLVAQEPSAPQTETKTKARAGKRVLDPARRVPMYFAQLGLSTDQRESIYKIQGKHMPKIDALEKQIEDLREQMLRECEAVLTPAQKQMLDQRRASGVESRSKKSAPSKAQP